MILLKVQVIGITLQRLCERSNANSRESLMLQRDLRLVLSKEVKVVNP